MKTSTTENGRLPRKTLSSQIDRLDEMLEGLAENLNDAVAMAVKDVVGQAVRQAVELAVQQTLAQVPVAQPAPAPQLPPAKPSFGERCKAAWNRVKQTTTRVATQVGRGTCRVFAWGLEKIQKLVATPAEWVLRLVWACQEGSTWLMQMVRSSWAQCRVVGLALAVGVGAGLGSYLAGPVIASLLTGLASALLTGGSMVMVSLLRWLSSSEPN